MDKKTFLCVLYSVLLILPAPLLGIIVAEKQEEKRKVDVQPISTYEGTTVPVPVFLALVAAYGIGAVNRYNIRSISNYHACAYNKGWCRPSCYVFEEVDLYNTDWCGSYKCCRPK